VKDLDLFNAIQTALKYVFERGMEQGVEKSVGIREALMKEVLEEGILHEGGDESLN
jgi:hypothetical protein